MKHLTTINSFSYEFSRRKKKTLISCHKTSIQHISCSIFCQFTKFWSCLNSKHLQICLNPFTNKPWFLHVCRTCLLKTQWEKEKLLVTSNFSFSHSVFYQFREHSAIFIKFKIAVSKLF